MEAFKGTKGLWEVHISGNGGKDFHTIRNTNGKVVAILYDKGRTKEETAANANLIAAAPYLAESLQELIDDVKIFYEGSVINKAYFEFKIKQAERALNEIYGD